MRERNIDILPELSAAEFRAEARVTSLTGGWSALQGGQTEDEDRTVVKSNSGFKHPQ